MIALLIASALGASSAVRSDTAGMKPRTQVETLKDWAVSRCIARGAPAPFAHDGAISAAALLERGDYGIEAYEAVEVLVGRQLAKRYGGSVPGGYVTLKCLDLRRSTELDRLVRHLKPTSVR